MTTETRTAKNLSIVIPTLGRACLRDCVRAIATGTMTPAEIIISHQGPIGALDTMLIELAEFGAPIRYLHSDQVGAAAGRNTGIRSVTTELFGTTDDDCIADSRWVEEIVGALIKHPHEIVTGRVLAGADGAPSVNSSEESRIYTRFPLKGGHFSGGNFGAALKLFKDVGPFDETELLRYCEDPEWSYRALDRGYPIRFIPEITVTHLHWRDDGDMEFPAALSAPAHGASHHVLVSRFEPYLMLRPRSLGLGETHRSIPVVRCQRLFNPVCFGDGTNKLKCSRIAVSCEGVIAKAGIQVKAHPIQQLSAGEFLRAWVVLGEAPRDDVIDQSVCVAMNLAR